MVLLSVVIAGVLVLFLFLYFMELRLIKKLKGEDVMNQELKEPEIVNMDEDDDEFAEVVMPPEEVVVLPKPPIPPIKVKGKRGRPRKNIVIEQKGENYV